MRILLTLSDRRWPADDAIVIDWGLWRIYAGGRLLLQGFPGHAYAGPSRPFRLAAYVICAAPFGSIDYADLIDALWGDDPDGGPLQPVNCIRAMLGAGRVADALRALGISLRTNYRGGLSILCSPLAMPAGGFAVRFLSACCPLRGEPR